MLSLRSFHIFFIVVAVVAADLFGAWAVRDFMTSGDQLILAMGLATIVGGFGLLGYGIWFVNKLDRANIH